MESKLKATNRKDGSQVLLTFKDNCDALLYALLMTFEYTPEHKRVADSLVLKKEIIPMG